MNLRLSGLNRAGREQKDLPPFGLAPSPIQPMRTDKCKDGQAYSRYGIYPKLCGNRIVGLAQHLALIWF